MDARIRKPHVLASAILVLGASLVVLLAMTQQHQPPTGHAQGATATPTAASTATVASTPATSLPTASGATIGHGFSGQHGIATMVTPALTPLPTRTP